LDGLDKKVDHTPLQEEEINIKQCLNNRLPQLLQEEEIKWYQGAKVKDLLEWDSNTKYFQLVASGKFRKTRIFQLQHEDMMIEWDQALKEYITTYYKNLFGPPTPSSFSLDEARVDDIEKMPHEENKLLTRSFSMDEV
jgi:hypothetical protein